MRDATVTRRQNFVPGLRIHTHYTSRIVPVFLCVSMPLW